MNLSKLQSEAVNKILELEILQDENLIVERKKLREVIDDKHWDYAKKVLKDVVETRNQLRYLIKRDIKALSIQSKGKIK